MSAAPARLPCPAILGLLLALWPSHAGCRFEVIAATEQGAMRPCRDDFSCRDDDPCTLDACTPAGCAHHPGCSDFGGFCDEARLCWESPLPIGASLLSVWVRSEEEIWVVGDSGLIMQWDGARWERFPSGTDELLQDVWVSPRGAVWVVGGAGTVLRLSGDGIDRLDAGTQANLLSVHGSADDDVWVVGSIGTALHHDGRGFTAVETGTDNPLHSVWVASPDLAWAGGSSATMLRWDGTVWTAQRMPHWSGIEAVWGLEPDGVLTVGPRGVVQRFDGQTWTQETATDDWLRGVSGSGPDDLWVVGEWFGTVLHGGPGAWTTVSTRMVSFAAVHAPVPGLAVMVGGATAVLRWDGEALAPLTNTLDAALSLQAIDGVSREALWVLGVNGRLYHRTAQGWVPGPRLTAGNDDPLYALGLWVANSNEVWAVGNRKAFRWRGDDLEELAVPGDDMLNAIFGFPPDDVWVVGVSGTALHWDGAAFARVASDTDAELRALWGASPDALWAVGDDGVALRWQPQQHGWMRQDFPSAAELRDVRGTAADDVWVTGEDQVYHFNGATWSAELVEEDHGSVWVDAHSGAVFVGALHHLWRREPATGQWAAVAGHPYAYYGATDLWGLDGDMLWLASWGGVRTLSLSAAEP